MNTKQGLKQILIHQLPAWILLFCVFQPVLDVIGYWQQKLGWTNLPTLLVRMVFLGWMVLMGFFLSEKKRLYLIFGGVAALYLAGHVAACLQAGSEYHWIEDLLDQIRTLYLPLTALCFVTFLRRNPESWSALQKSLVVNFGLILLVMLLSAVTGTDPHFYETKNLGVRGWFIWKSPQSAILCMLVPMVIAWAERRFDGRRIPLAGVSLICFTTLFLAGTRLAFFCIAATGFGWLLLTLLFRRKKLRQALVILLCAVLLLALFPLSPMSRNQKEISKNIVIKQDRINAAAGVSPGTETTDDTEALAAAYRYNLQGLIDRFGIETVAHYYHNTLSARKIFENRIMRIAYCHLLMEQTAEKAPLARWFGLEIGQMHRTTEVYDFYSDSFRTDQQTFDPENDLHGVYYLCGIVGLLLLIAVLLTAAVRLALYLLYSRQPLTAELTGLAIAYGAGLLYAFETNSTLRRNNASVYLGLVIAAIWYLCGRTENDGRKMEEPT